MENVEWSLPVVFHFLVKIGGAEESFQVVEGLSTSIECEEIRSGGDNSRSFFLPKHCKHDDLVLKKGFIHKDSIIYEWCKNTFASMNGEISIETRNVLVSLLNEKKQPLRTWHFIRAYPYKWSLGSLDAMKNEIAIESISLKYESMSSV